MTKRTEQEVLTAIVNKIEYYETMIETEKFHGLTKSYQKSIKMLDDLYMNLKNGTITQYLDSCESYGEEWEMWMVVNGNSEDI